MDHVKKPSERVFHAMLYELCATLMLVPLAAWIMGKSLGQMGGLSLMMAGVAMLCNMLFNALFERAERRWKLRRTVRVRCLHALLFEGTLVVLLVPLAAWWLSVSYWQALLLDLGFFVFFLPYTYVFNWGYDMARAAWVRRRQAMTVPS